MAPFDPLIGEYRVHYAGFFDPGFGYAEGKAPGAKAVLEVRSLDIPFILEDGQIVGRLVYDKLTDIPTRSMGAAHRFAPPGARPEAVEALASRTRPSNCRRRARRTWRNADGRASTAPCSNMPPSARAASCQRRAHLESWIVRQQRAGQHHGRAAPLRFTTMRLEAHITSFGSLCRMPQQAFVISGTSACRSISGTGRAAAGS